MTLPSLPVTCPCPEALAVHIFLNTLPEIFHAFQNITSYIFNFINTNSKNTLPSTPNYAFSFNNIYMKSHQISKYIDRFIERDDRDRQR